MTKITADSKHCIEDLFSAFYELDMCSAQFKSDFHLLRLQHYCSIYLGFEKERAKETISPLLNFSSLFENRTLPVGN